MLWGVKKSCSLLNGEIALLNIGIGFEISNTAFKDIRAFVDDDSSISQAQTKMEILLSQYDGGSELF